MLERLNKFLARKIIAIAERRPHDFAIGGGDDPYMLRWYIIPRNRFFNIYLHHMRRNDIDVALHDHPWPSLSWCLRGRIREWTFNEQWQEQSAWVLEGTWVFRTAELAHRLEVEPGEAWTLFITGPALRGWGFWCIKEEAGARCARFVPWADFVDERDSGKVGRGCGEH